MKNTATNLFIYMCFMVTRISSPFLCPRGMLTFIVEVTNDVVCKTVPKCELGHEPNITHSLQPVFVKSRSDTTIICTECKHGYFSLQNKCAQCSSSCESRVREKTIKNCSTLQNTECNCEVGWYRDDSSHLCIKKCTFCSTKSITEKLPPQHCSGLPEFMRCIDKREIQLSSSKRPTVVNNTVLIQKPTVNPQTTKLTTFVRERVSSIFNNVYYTNPLNITTMPAYSADTFTRHTRSCHTLHTSYEITSHTSHVIRDHVTHFTRHTRSVIETHTESIGKFDPNNVTHHFSYEIGINIVIVIVTVSIVIGFVVFLRWKRNQHKAVLPSDSGVGTAVTTSIDERDKDSILCNETDDQSPICQSLLHCVACNLDGLPNGSWERLARELQVEEVKITNIRLDEITTYDKSYKMLTYWTKENLDVNFGILRQKLQRVNFPFVPEVIETLRKCKCYRHLNTKDLVKSVDENRVLFTEATDLNQSHQNNLMEEKIECQEICVTEDQSFKTSSRNSENFKNEEKPLLHEYSKS